MMAIVENAREDLGDALTKRTGRNIRAPDGCDAARASGQPAV
jgi:hypothetical protein